MARIPIEKTGSQNLQAFLDMIAYSELGTALLAVTDDGYNVIVGSTAARPILFNDYAKHPNRLIGTPLIKVASTAAGRYQLLSRYFDTYQRELKLPDFSPVSQDKIALQQIRESGAKADVMAGRFAAAVAKCAHIWASLPGAGYGQRENKLSALQTAYLSSGGVMAA